MKRSRFVPLASAILLLLTAGAALAENPQPQSPDPEALLQEIFSPPAIDAQPAAAGLPCVAWGICRLCSDGIRRQPCIATRCGTGPVTYSGCGSCTTSCVPPDV
ncbi:MAG TPA: hypothetical protein VJ725_24090 [Thermoanaerobaculia bacterium]|nr:hypothetical protein [Thermoanaerobaculia bacterium]